MSTTRRSLVRSQTKPPPPPQPPVNQSQATKPTPNPGELPLEYFCNNAITVPPTLPDILKQYAKNAMKTHPPDLLVWSGAYFR